MRRLLTFLVIGVLATGLGACSSSSKKSSSGGAAITIKDLAFTVAPVKSGSTVTIKNNDSFTHTVTADEGNAFDVSIDGGKTATFTASSTAGDVKFHCKIHSTMHGTLKVE